MPNTFPNLMELSNPSIEAPAILEPPKPIWRRWVKWFLLILAIIWLADSGISLLIQHSRLKNYLTGQLSAAFGRPVEVKEFRFSLWTGPRFDAYSVMVAEDPRFGHEYFLRSEVVRARIRLFSLLRGRLELETLSLSQPSLNLVRNEAGDWNLAEWLPRPTGAASGVPYSSESAPYHALRFQRIEIEGGRINFKRRDEKLPFAFVDVGGSIEAEALSRWRVNLVAVPERAATIVQDPGILHLTAVVGGTSSRLRPAALNFRWTRAAISDVLHLVRNYDYGLRGALDFSIDARTEGDSWILQGNAQMRQLHRWDLPSRPDNPSVDVTVAAKLDVQDSMLELASANIETPHSNLRARGSIDWGQLAKSTIAIESSGANSPDSFSIGLADVLPWVRAFCTGTAEDISLHGWARTQMTISGWPLKPHDGSLLVRQADLTGPELRVPITTRSLTIKYGPDGLKLAPATLSFGSRDGVLRMEGELPTPSGISTFHVSGNVSHVRDLITTAAAFGWNLSRGWDLEGPLQGDLRWQGGAYPWRVQPSGSLEWGFASGNASLRAPFLNQPIEHIRARADWKLASDTIALTSAQAFGARWSGSFFRRDALGAWQFALDADRLDAGDLDRWLNPQWRESLIARFLPFLNPHSPSIALPEDLRGNGRITINEFSLAPWELTRLRGALNVDGRSIELRDARAQFYGGNVTGSLDANLASIPAYRAQLDFSSVSLQAFSAASPALESLFGGSATGYISLRTAGSNRSQLVSSLSCDGQARIDNAELRGLDLAESLHSAAPVAGQSSFTRASGSFRCSDGKVMLQDLTLSAPEAEIHGRGTVSLRRDLNLQLRAVTIAIPPNSSAYRLTGSLLSPQIRRLAEDQVSP